MRTFGREGTVKGEYSNPTSIRVIDHQCYISSYGASYIQVVSRDGTYIRRFACGMEPIMHIHRARKNDDSSPPATPVTSTDSDRLIVAATANCIEVYV